MNLAIASSASSASSAPAASCALRVALASAKNGASVARAAFASAAASRSPFAASRLSDDPRLPLLVSSYDDTNGPGVEAFADKASAVAALAVAVPCGSHHEAPASRGAAHALSCLAFRGDVNRTWTAHSYESSMRGVLFGATHSRDHVIYAAVFPRNELEFALDQVAGTICAGELHPWLLRDLMPRLHFETKEYFSCPGVVAREAAYERVFRGTGLGNPLTFAAREHSLEFKHLEAHAAQYRRVGSSGVAVSCAGVPHSEFSDAVLKAFKGASSAAGQPVVAAAAADHHRQKKECFGGEVLMHGRTADAGIVLAFPGAPRSDAKKNATLHVLAQLVSSLCAKPFKPSANAKTTTTTAAAAGLANPSVRHLILRTLRQAPGQAELASLHQSTWNLQSRHRYVMCGSCAVSSPRLLVHHAAHAHAGLFMAEIVARGGEDAVAAGTAVARRVVAVLSDIAANRVDEATVAAAVRTARLHARPDGRVALAAAMAVDHASSVVPAATDAAIAAVTRDAIAKAAADILRTRPTLAATGAPGALPCLDDIMATTPSQSPSPSPSPATATATASAQTL